MLSNSMAKLAKKKWYKNDVFFYFVLLILLIVLPFFVGSYVLQILILSLIFAILGLSWNLAAGYSGIFSFGHQAFFGIGAYASAIISIELEISPWLGLIIGGILAAVAGGIISFPILRLRIIPYIAISTLGFAEIIRLMASNFSDLTRGELGLSGIPAFTSIGPLDFNLANRINIYFLVLTILILTVLFITKIINGPRGLALKSMRESQDAAESLGVNLRNNKLYIFMISAFIAGVSGALYAHYVQVLTPSSEISVDLMLQILLIVAIGGMRTVIGPVVGAFIVVI